MKKAFLIFVFLVLMVLCGCSEEEIPQKPPVSPSDESVLFTIGGKEYELSVPEKTRITDNGEGYVEIFTSSLTEPYTTIDLSGLSGCEYILSLAVTLNGENEKLILPKLQNLSFCDIFGNPSSIDASGIEGCERISFETSADEIKIGKGPENLELGYGFDLSALAGAENVKSVTVHGNVDLSKIADMGEVEKVYIFGENENVAGLENLKSLKRLSFQSFSGDLSGVGNLSMETLVFNSDIKQETLDTLTKSETVTELHLNDEFITKADFLEKLPNLKTIILSVMSGSSLEAIDEAQLEELETNIPKEPLKEFIKNGGEIYLVYDWSRT